MVPPFKRSLGIDEYIGDILYVKGKVIETRVEAGADRGLVKCEIRGENQRGELTAAGAATVALLRR